MLPWEREGPSELVILEKRFARISEKHETSNAKAFLRKDISHLSPDFVVLLWKLVKTVAFSLSRISTVFISLKSQMLCVASF